MSRRIGILAALPSELKPLVQGWKRVAAPKLVSMWEHVDADGDTLIAACAGMGANAARRTFAAAELGGALDCVLTVGLAGATGAAGKVGDVSCVSEVVDVQTGERFQLDDGRRKLRLATVTHAAGKEEKARLAATYGAVLVDMEAATVARLATMRNLPLCAIKAVSDLADATLPEIDRFVDTEGQLQIVRFASFFAARPRYWGAVATLAKGSKAASQALADGLKSFLQHKDWGYTNQTGQLRREL